MKKNGIIIIIYSIGYVAYILFMHLIKSVKGTNYWIGFLFMTIAFVLATILTIFANNRKSLIFPMDISMVVLANIYLVLTIILTIKYGKAVKIGKEIVDVLLTRQFLIYEFVCLLVFVVICMVVGLNKKHVSNNETSISKEMDQRQDLISKLEVLISRIKVIDGHKELIKKLENLIDDIKFCNINNDLDDSLLNEKIDININKLGNEINNIIEINTIDYSSIDDIMLSIKEQLIKKKRIERK